MKVRFVLRSFGGPGGTEKYASDLAGWLVGQGVGVEVWCERADSESCRGLDVRRIPAAASGRAGERAFHRAVRGLERGSVDVVQGFGRTVGHDVWRAGGGAHQAWLEASTPSAAGRWVRSLILGERWAIRMDRAAIAAAKVVICNSRMAREDLVRCYGAHPEKVRVVRNGVDGARFRPDPDARARARLAWQVPEGGRVALFLGSGFRRKGLDVASRAFQRISGPKDRFVVIGRDSRSRSRLGRVRRRLGQRLVEVGPVRDPEAWLPGADATVLPTLYDAAANTTLEALSCGVPPVTTSRDGSAEVVPEPDWVVTDPRDAEQVAAALARAWEAGPALASQCREAAAEWTLERNGTTMLDVYEEILNG